MKRNILWVCNINAVKETSMYIPTLSNKTSEQATSAVLALFYFNLHFLEAQRKWLYAVPRDCLVCDDVIVVMEQAFSLSNYNTEISVGKWGPFSQEPGCQHKAESRPVPVFVSSLKPVAVCLATPRCQRGNVTKLFPNMPDGLTKQYSDETQSKHGILRVK